MIEYETIEYSVCEDCLHYLANDDAPVEGPDHAFFAEKIAGELRGREGHFSLGVEQTDGDPEGYGYYEFSWRDCELCRSPLGGSRHGVTLFVKEPG